CANNWRFRERPRGGGPMGEARLATRLPALFLLAIALLSGAEASLALRAGNGADAAASLGATFLILAAVLGIGALACLVAAWRLWNAPARETPRTAALFGRNAE